MSLLDDTYYGDVRFPKRGYDARDIESRLVELRGALTPETEGSLSMHALADSEHFMPDFRALGDAAFEAFKRFNAFFTGLEPAAGAIEDDVLDMCVEIFRGGADGRCNITSGGTESIYCAMLAMREWARARRPDLERPAFVAPYTAHAAFSRAAHCFGLEIRRVPVGAERRVDPAAMEAAVDDAVVGIVASAPNWPYGLFDPVEAIAEVAVRRDLWCHVDACVGGYLAPFARKAGYAIPEFDLTVPGVSSLSADLHKYGYVPKPCSTVLWRSEEQQQYHYFVADDWPEGPYLTQALLGTRPFAPTAAAWAMLNALGEEGFVEIARRVMETKAKLVDGIAGIEGLDPWQNDLSLLVVSSEVLDIKRVVAAMRAKRWVLFGAGEPEVMHLTVDPLDDAVIERFLVDLRDAAASVRAGEDVGCTRARYGLGGGDRSPRWIERALALVERRKAER